MAKATAGTKKRGTKNKTDKPKGIRFSKRRATAKQIAQAAKCPPPRTKADREHEELLRGHIAEWQKQLAKCDVDLPTAETIKATASLYWRTRYVQEKPDTPLYYHTAAGKACNEFIRLIMSWMRKANPDNLAIDSAFQNVVCAVRNGDFTGTLQLAALLKKQSESPARGKQKRKKTTPNTMPTAGTKRWYKYVIFWEVCITEHDTNLQRAASKLTGKKTNTVCREFWNMSRPSQQIRDRVRASFPGKDLHDVFDKPLEWLPPL